MTYPDMTEEEHLHWEALAEEQSEARARLLNCLLPGALVGVWKREWRSRNPAVNPDCKECGGQGWGWSTPLVQPSRPFPAECDFCAYWAEFGIELERL